MRSRSFRRWPFAIAIVVAMTAVGALCFLWLDHLEPFADLDYRFYAIIYTSIGAATGIAAWYCARLTATGCVSPLFLSLALTFPYAFILFLALDKNPYVAAIATIAFGFILLLTWLGHRVRTQQPAN